MKSSSANVATVLFLSNREKQCGVHHFGERIARVLAGSQKYRFEYVEVDSEETADAEIRRHQPRALLWNYNPINMRWLSPRFLHRIPLPNVQIFHEVNQANADAVTSKTFDYHVAPDPTLLLKNPIVFKTGRLVEEYENRSQLPAIPTIGSFGLGTAGKGFERLVALVQEEFEQALIRLNIPNPDFLDAHGTNSETIAAACRRVLWKPGIRLEISHEFLDDRKLLDFLAANTLNAFLYEEGRGQGVSSVCDFALAVQRPIALSSSRMLRHMDFCQPSLRVEHRSLSEIIAAGTAHLEPLRKTWCAANLLWDYEQAVSAVLSKPIKRPVTLPHPRLQRVWNRISRRFSPPPRRKWVQVNGDKVSAPGTRSSHVYTPPTLPDQWPLNRILNDEARDRYRTTLAQLWTLAPEVMYRKIPEANVQQAFVLDTTYRIVRSLNAPRILCVGSYEDSAAWSLRRLGFQLDEIDPVVNYDLATFLTRPTTSLASYDVVFSTSVIEHVPEDARFVRDIASLLKPGGTAVLTCDFRDDFKAGDVAPPSDLRLYTHADITERLLPEMRDCELVGSSGWRDSAPDFHFLGHVYSFASIVFKKR